MSIEGYVNQIDLNHRHAVITGGAQGIGLSVATRLLASGASVSLWDRDAEVLKSALDQLQGEGTISSEIVDVSNVGSVNVATENAILKHGKIDILVASAGIAGPNRKTWEYPIDAWKQVMDINLTGVFLLLSSHCPSHASSELRTHREYFVYRR
jgi:3-oxoacyl-[acyl-carrier protein] reductase